MVSTAVRPSSQSGFTLIELMIVVAIIGILAATAIPSFQRFQLRTKASEARLILTAMRSSEGSYFAEYGTFIPFPAEPQTSGPAAIGPTTVKRIWANCPNPVTLASPGYCVIGFRTEGPTYYDYAVGTVNAVGGPPNVDYFSVGQSDIDGDAVFNYWGIRVAAQDGSTNAPTPLAGCAQVLDAATGASVTNLIGPCVAGSGASVF